MGTEVEALTSEHFVHVARQLAHSLN
jgi:hypothetical protein